MKKAKAVPVEQGKVTTKSGESLRKAALKTPAPRRTGAR